MGDNAKLAQVNNCRFENGEEGRGSVGMAEYSYILGLTLIIIHGCAATFAALTLGISERMFETPPL